MKDRPDLDFATAIDALNEAGAHVVWSLIVSIFGDLAQRPGDAISGLVLSQILERIGIRPESMRVALHRLRKDGWLLSKRQGRISSHYLTELGLAESAAASPRIYGTGAQNGADWHILLYDTKSDAETSIDDRDLLARGHVKLAAGLYLGQGEPAIDPGPGFFMRGRVKHVPHWLLMRILPEDIEAKYHNLGTVLCELCAWLKREPDLTALEVATLRALIVHNWRRLVLRVPDLPDGFYPSDWAGSACRAAALAALDLLGKPDIAELESNFGIGAQKNSDI